MTFELEFEDLFDGDAIDTRRWLPCYLPHWSSRARSAARYAIGDGVLRLRIESDQLPWCPEYDDGVRVSSLKPARSPALFGSAIGQHRFNPAAVVREAQRNVRMYTPLYGRIELRAATDDANSMVALWMIGFEDAPERWQRSASAIFGRDVTPDDVIVGVGVHPFGDPEIRDEFYA